MGNDQPGTNASQTTTQNSIQDDEEFFVLEQIEKIKLQGTANDIVFLWIDPRIYNDENGKNLKIFKNALKTIEQFSSISSLQNQLNDIDSHSIVVVISAASLPQDNFVYMNNERRITEIVLFCQNQERAKLLKNNFNKIKSVGYNPNQVLLQIQQLRKRYPPKGFIKNSMLFMTEDDTPIMNKYRLNYFCLTNLNNKSAAKKDFENLAKNFCPNQLQAINDFASKYQLGLSQEARRKQTLEWIFRDCFYWDLVETLPKITTDPRKLAYLRLPVKDIYETVLTSYKTNTKKPKRLYVIVQLSQNQQKQLQQNKQNFMIFTTFMKGYTNEKKANVEFKKRTQKGQKVFKFDILLARSLFESLDFGFIVIDEQENSSRPDVIFNLYNFFQLIELSFESKRGTLEYGSLAKLFGIRQNPNLRKDLKDNQRNLLRNYDYLEDLMKKIKNQGNVLQLSGYFKESIEIYDKKLEEITRTNKPAAMLDEFRIQKGDTLKSCQEYELAEKQYFSVETDKLKLVAKVRLIELYIMRRNQAKVQQLLNELDGEITKLKEWGFTQDYFRAKNYIGLSMMRKDKFKQAKKFYKQLKHELSEHYDYKMEGIPLVHEIYRNLALSETKLNNHEQALNLLNSTKNWLQASQGKGPTLILTQKMIQNVYHSKGDQDGVQQSKQAIQRLIEQSTVNINLIDASRGSVKAQQSIQQSLVAINLDDGPSQKNETNLLQQSAINIQF